MNIFALLFEIFYSGSGSKVRNENFFFRSFSTYPDPFSLEMKPEWCFLIFWIFLPFFLDFSILGGARRIETINFFLSFSICPDPFWLEIRHEWCFLIFFALFMEFSIQGRVGRIGTIIFFSFFLDLCQLVLAWNEAWIVHFNFLYFFAIFFRIFYSWSGRKDRNDNFLFLSFVTCPNPFWP